MFIVLEIQKTDDATIAPLVHTADTQNKAESVFHMVLAAAALSEVPVHSAILLTDEGIPLNYASYVHEKEVPETIGEEVTATEE